MIATHIIDNLEQAEELWAEWDALACENAMPTVAPAWMLSWWRHLAPAGALLRIVAVLDGKRLIGIAPLYCDPPRRGQPTTYRLLAADFSTSVAPLATADRAWEVGEAIARTLAQTDPRPDLLALEPMPLVTPWLPALRDGWPSVLRPASRRYDVQSMPVVSLREDSFDEWFQDRSPKFRSNTRRLRRLAEQEGATTRLSTPQTLRADAESFMQLHALRWEGRGSRLTALDKRLTEMLVDVGMGLLDEGRESKVERGPRFRMRVTEVKGEAVCVDVSIAGGGEIVGFNMGWDERFKRFSPALLAFMSEIADGFAFGDRRVQLGWGGNMYKLRFANGNDPVAWGLLLLPGPRLPLALARTGPLTASAWARNHGKRLLSPEQIERIRPLARLMPR